MPRDLEGAGPLEKIVATALGEVALRSWLDPIVLELLACLLPPSRGVLLSSERGPTVQYRIMLTHDIYLWLSLNVLTGRWLRHGGTTSD